jgi:putative acetyltransferase
VTISNGSSGWYGLGPISVLPELQRLGVGKSLIREGFSRLRALGARGCVLVGDPAYYERFGFRSLPDLFVENVPQQYSLALVFCQDMARGKVTFHEGFDVHG